MNVAPAKLMPKSPSVAEHHRVLGLAAVHAGNTISTIKAHHIRQNDFEERLEAVEGVHEAVWSLRAELEAQRNAGKETANQINKALSEHGALIGQLNERLVAQSSSSELKKAIVTGIVTVLVAIVTAYGGYTMAHKSDASTDPMTRDQIHQIDEKIKAFDPNNVKRENR